MNPLPAFHAKAKADGEARTQSLVGERDRASLFLEELDALLAEAVGLEHHDLL